MAYLIRVYDGAYYDYDGELTPESQEQANSEYREFEAKLNVRDGPHPYTWGLERPAPAKPYVCLTEKTAEELTPYMVIGTTKVIVSETVREKIEQMEPGVHRFFLVELELSSGEDTPEQYYILNICTRIKAIDADRSDIYIKEFPPEIRKGLSDDRQVHFDFKGVKPGYEHKPVRLYAKKEVIAGRAVWAEDGFRSGHYFMSEGLYDFIMARGGLGVSSANEYVEEV